MAKLTQMAVKPSEPSKADADSAVRGGAEPEAIGAAFGGFGGFFKFDDEPGASMVD